MNNLKQIDNLEQIENLKQNIISSFSLAKSDIMANKAEIENLKRMQLKLLSIVNEIRLRQALGQENRQDIHQTEIKNKTEEEIKSRTKEKFKFISSKTGKKYHTENCVFAKNINPKNRIEFRSKTSAVSKGYTACKCV